MYIEFSYEFIIQGEAMKTFEDYERFPESKIPLLEEIRTAFDDYDDGKLNDVDLISLMKHYQKYEKGKCLGTYDGTSFQLKRSTKKWLGKSRSKRLEQILSTEINFLEKKEERDSKQD